MSDWTKSSKDTFNRITNPDGTPVRDKDNAQLVLKPSYSRRPAPNLAPGGAVGIKQRRPANDLVPKLTKNQKAKAERIHFTKSQDRDKGGMER